LASLDLLLDAEVVGEEMHELMRELFPLPRSLTGEGVRETLRILEREIPLEWTEIPSGTRLYDWTVPKEWNIHDAWVADANGRRVIDFGESNLHVLGYSVPTRGTFDLDELRPHLFTIPEHPEWVPFRTSYHHENWGFCLSEDQLRALEGGRYEVCIDSTLADGSLTYAESFIQGGRSDEVLISTYICHPSLANDNLSGIVLTAMLAKYLRGLSLRYSYRFLFSPGTLGPLGWLERNESTLERVHCGLVCSCVGDPGKLTYKRSRGGDAEIDRAAANVLRTSGAEYEVMDFVPWGGDERQFSSPGFDLPVGCLTRTPAGEYPEYHSSADDLDFVQPRYLAEAFQKYLLVLGVLEGNATYERRNPKGEPQLGKRGLYKAISTGAPREEEAPQRALLWVLNLADGEHSLLDISDRSGIPFSTVREAADRLLEHDLLEEAR
jgi:aminopeptidase-like protein